MSVCNPCLTVRVLPKCFTSLTIGTIADFNEDILIYFKNYTLDKCITFENTSDGAGEVVQTFIDTKFLMEQHTYQLWITLFDAESPDDREIITVGIETTTCISFRVKEVLSEDGTLKVIPDAEFQLIT